MSYLYISSCSDPGSGSLGCLTFFPHLIHIWSPAGHHIPPRAGLRVASRNASGLCQYVGQGSAVGYWKEAAGRIMELELARK